MITFQWTAGTPARALVTVDASGEILFPDDLTLEEAKEALRLLVKANLDAQFILHENSERRTAPCL